VKGEWKLRSRPKAEIGQKEDDPNDWAKIYDLMATLETRIAREIAAGQYPTAEDARRAIDGASRTPPAEPPPQ